MVFRNPCRAIIPTTYEATSNDIPSWGWYALEELVDCVNNTIDPSSTEHRFDQETLWNSFRALSDKFHGDVQVLNWFTKSDSRLQTGRPPFKSSATIYVPAGWGKKVLKAVRASVRSVGSKVHKPGLVNIGPRTVLVAPYGAVTRTFRKPGGNEVETQMRPGGAACVD